MLIIELAFPAGRYHGTPWGRHVNEGVAEWPPSPYRLVRALYDAWKRKRPDWGQDRIERVLSTLSAAEPSYLLPDASASHTRSFLSKNEKNPQSKTLIFDGFVVLSPSATVLIGWPDIKAEPAVTNDLEELLAVMNYLGRSESWVQARLLHDISGVHWNCTPDFGGIPDSMDVIPIAAPVPKQQFATVKLGGGRRTKQLTWIDALATGTEITTKFGWSRPPAMKYVNYLRRSDCFEPAITTELNRRKSEVRSVLYVLDSKVLPRITETLEFAERVRRKLMGIHKRITASDQPASPRFSGKTSAGTPMREQHLHAFYLPLDSNRDARLDHLLVHCHSAFETKELMALDQLDSVWQGFGRPDIRLIPVQWDAPRKKTRTVISATPFIPTRHFKPKRYSFEDWIRAEIARECHNHGLPEPISIRGTPELHLQGSRSVRWFEFRRNRKDDPVCSGFGLRLEFDQEVETPFSLGYACHFGLGQFRSVERSS